MCLRRCFGADDDNEESLRRGDHRGPIANASAGSVSRSTRSAYHATRQSDVDDESDDGSNEDCCRGGTTSRSSSTGTPTAADGPSHNVIQEFWSRLRDRLAKFEFDHDGEVGGGRRGENASILRRSSNRSHGIFRRATSEPKATGRKAKTLDTVPFLRTASTFDESKEIPSINADAIVLPGSKLQAQMAAAAQKSLDEMGDECVICMESFDATNPRMPTLCGCGENKTYFHLPCLYQWVEQNKNCPSCRKRLRWEEF